MGSEAQDNLFCAGVQKTGFISGGYVEVGGIISQPTEPEQIAQYSSQKATMLRNHKLAQAQEEG